MLAYSQTPSLLLSKKTDIDLNNALRKIISMVKMPDNFEINIPEERHQLNISAVAFEQIFINLLSNAIRYNDKDRGIVNVRFAHDDDFYRFEVEDNGIGIANEYHEKIFSNNFTLKITDRYNDKGTGIGLSTVKDLIKALKGTIHVKSTLGKGATFFIAIRK